MNGESVYSAKESSKQEDVCEFLHEIRRKNPIGKIVIITDNFASHKSRKVKAMAERLDITLVFFLHILQI